jgi:hypothetical protein
MTTREKPFFTRRHIVGSAGVQSPVRVYIGGYAKGTGEPNINRSWPGAWNSASRSASSFWPVSFGEDYAVTGRSLLVFGLAAGDSMTRRLRHGMGSISDAIERPL